MEAYDKALSINPKHTEARENRDTALREAKSIEGGVTYAPNLSIPVQASQPAPTSLSVCYISHECRSGCYHLRDDEEEPLKIIVHMRAHDQ